MQKSISIYSAVLIGLILLCGSAYGQGKYWVLFEDKGPEAAQFAANPDGLISERSLERRRKMGQGILESDYPVSASYIRQLRDAGVQVHATSKWLNAASISTELDYLSLQRACPSIRDMQPLGRFVSMAANESPPPSPPEDSNATAISYGVTEMQLEKIGVTCLHDRGFQGQGVLMAVFDAGFYNVDTFAAFDSTWLNNRVLTYYDFVDGDTTIFDESTHGLSVISTIIGNLPGQYVGAAPHVSVVMARTEDVSSETHQEEDNWMQAMEWADSIGVDIIQSSLGYSTFDPGEGDYTYQDLDGNVALITQAADMAAARGILVVTSAGNEGNGSWRYITAPCDADSVLCVGSVNFNDSRSSFSSVGPSADNQVKPDVMAMGGGTNIIGVSGNPGTGSGTSYAAPQMAGLVACLLSAHPLRSNMDVIQAVRESGSTYHNPDSLFGYGIPNACVADSILDVMDSLALENETMQQIRQNLNIFPNPVTDKLVIEITGMKWRIQQLDVLNPAGMRVLRSSPQSDGAESPDQSRYELNVKDLPSGMYILKMDFGGGKLHTHKFIRQ